MATDAEVEALRQRLAEEQQRREAAERERDAGQQRQAAMAAILELVNRSAPAVEPVLLAVAEQAMRLTDCVVGGIIYLDQEETPLSVRVAVPAFAGLAATAAGWTVVRPGQWLSRTYPRSRLFQWRTTMGEALRTAQPVQAWGDRAALVARYPDTEFPDGYHGPQLRAAVPLVRQGEVRGVLFVTRTGAESMAPPQLTLLQAFADQAVLAMENARLFDDLQARTRELEAGNASLTEALEHQRATAEVLEVISRSPTDLQAVLNAIVERAGRPLDSHDASLSMHREASVVTVSRTRNGTMVSTVRLATPATFADYLRTRSIHAAVATERRTVAVAGGPEALGTRFPHHAPVQAAAQARGELLPGSMVFVPLVRDAAVFGALGVRRPAAEPYTDRQIALLETFAGQAGDRDGEQLPVRGAGAAQPRPGRGSGAADGGSRCAAGDLPLGVQSAGDPGHADGRCCPPAPGPRRGDASPGGCRPAGRGQRRHQRRATAVQGGLGDSARRRQRDGARGPRWSHRSSHRSAEAAKPGNCCTPRSNRGVGSNDRFIEVTHMLCPVHQPAWGTERGTRYGDSVIGDQSRPLSVHGSGNGRMSCEQQEGARFGGGAVRS